MTDVADEIRADLESDPETVVYASVDPNESTAIFDVASGNLNAEVKAIGLLILKVAIQTGHPPETVADEAVGLAKELMDDGS